MNDSAQVSLRLVMVGASGHGLVVADVVRCESRWELVGFLDSGKPVGIGPAGLPILGPGEAVAELARVHGFTGCIVAVGHNDVRRCCVAMLREQMPTLRFATAVHPAATVAADVEIGEGTVVMAGAVINPGCRIGRHCIVNTGACLDHESTMGDFSSLAQALATLAAAEPLRRTLGAAACRRVKEQFDAKVINEAVVAEYFRLARSLRLGAGAA